MILHKHTVFLTKILTYTTLCILAILVYGNETFFGHTMKKKAMLVVLMISSLLNIFTSVIQGS